MPSDQSHSANGEFGIGVVNPLEIADWDQRVGCLPGSGFFHRSAWARVLKESYGYSPSYLVLNDSEGLKAALPLMEVDSWLTGKRGVALPFTDRCEPLALTSGAAGQLFNAAIELGIQRSWKYLEYCGGRQFLSEQPASTVFYGHQLDLRGGKEALLFRFNGAIRRAIKKAGRQDGLKIEFARDVAATEAFYRLHCLTRKRHGLPPQPFQFFANIQRYVLAEGHGWIGLATQGETPVAGAVYFHSGRDALYKYGASDESRLDLRANQQVMWEAICRYAAEGYESLDFGRTSLSNEGLRQYKLNWGTIEKRLEYFRYDLRSRKYVATSDNSTGTHALLFRYLPMPFLKCFGRIIYKHIG